MQPNWRESKNIDVSIVAIQGTYRSLTRCVCDPPRAAELSAVAEGCSHAMVGAQLWLWRSSAARNGQKGIGVHTTSPTTGVSMARPKL